MIRAATEEEILKYAEIMGYRPSRGAKGVALLEEKSISALCIFDHWTYSAVQVHVYAAQLKSLFNQEYLGEVFEYAFGVGRCRVLISSTPEDHKGSLAVSEWLGFKEFARIPDGWSPGVAMILKALRREDCRFWPYAVASEGA